MVGLVDCADVILCCCTGHNVSVYSVTVGLVDCAEVILCYSTGHNASAWDWLIVQM
jgi:hypothetical protein